MWKDREDKGESKEIITDNQKQTTNNNQQLTINKQICKNPQVEEDWESLGS